MKHKVRVSLCACLLVASGILFGNACSTSAQVPARSPGPSAKLSPFGTKSSVVESFVQPPLSFEANLGQTDPGVRFLARGQGYTPPLLLARTQYDFGSTCPPHLDAFARHLTAHALLVWLNTRF